MSIPTVCCICFTAYAAAQNQPMPIRITINVASLPQENGGRGSAPSGVPAAAQPAPTSKPAASKPPKTQRPSEDFIFVPEDQERGEPIAKPLVQPKTTKRPACKS